MRLSALCLAGLAAIGLMMAAPMAAQVPETGTAGILVLDEEALFERSAFGRRVLRDVETASAVLASENRALEAELAAEERRLADLRDETEPEDFREMADAFDARVVATRAEQDAKAVALSRRLEAERTRFFEAALPALLEEVEARGAQVVLERRSVVLASEGVDITDALIGRIDARLGDGTDGTGPDAGHLPE
ncbi:MAG: OmpH family outer membrane protein [Rhodobacteraceae bacterium]|nr:OmpH family outer membrane protein [Paracoccaceae bacterium]